MIPGKVIRFWIYDSDKFAKSQVEEIRSKLPANLSIKYHYGDKCEAFYRIYKKKGSEKSC
jgi:hypothetical protein